MLHKAYNLRHVTKFLCLAMTLLAGVNSNVQQTITGLGYKDTSDFGGLRHLSIAGGAPILLSGLNFASSAGSNSWKFEPWWLEGAVVFGPAMTSDDQMNSNDLAGRLGYIAPSAWELMGQDGIESFNGDFLPNGYWDPQLGNDLKFTVVIQNNEDGWDVECSNIQKCRFGYMRDYTPLLIDVTPPNVAKGSEIYFQMDAKSAHRITPDDQPPYRSIKMGQYLLDTEDIIEDEDRLNGWTHDSQYAIMTDSASMNSTEPKILFYNGLAVVLRSATHCNFANDDCWVVRVHPRIDTVSFNQGYTTGGQHITIKGSAFNGTNINVMVGGVECRVTDSDLDYIKCVTGAADSISPIGYQPGQPGLTQIQTDVDYNEYLQLAPTFDVMNLNSSQPISGWFKAPATGSYRFYVSCLSACSLNMNYTHPFNSSDIQPEMLEMETIASRDRWTTWRNYHYIKDDGHYSEWIELTEGNHYYMHGITNQIMSVGLEFSNTTGVTETIVTGETCECETVTNSTTNTTSEECTCTETTADVPVKPWASHPHAQRQVQQIAMEHTVVKEEWSVTITNPDSDSYKLSFVDSSVQPPRVFNTAALRANAAASTFRTRINAYYRRYYKCGTSVTLEMFDSEGQETTTLDNAVTLVYKVKVDKLIDGFSASVIQAVKVADKGLKSAKTAASISVTTPMNGQQSSPPFKGNYVIQCTDNQGFTQTSRELEYNAPMWKIKWSLHQKMSMMLDKVEVIWDYRFPHWENGISYLLWFHGVDYEIPACEIIPSGDNALTGNHDMAQNVTVMRPYGESLFFETIPMEMLHTDAQTPQISVTIDGMNAFCNDLSCDFLYTASESMMTEQHIDENDLLTISGTLMPNANSDRATLGPVSCSILSQTETEVQCQLDDTRVAGQWKANIRTQFGLTPSEIATTIDVPVVLNSVSPAADVSYLGGDEITITGDHFGYNPSVITVTYDDGTECEVISAQMTSLTCINKVFSSGAAGSSQGITVTINGMSDSSLSVDMLNAATPTFGLSPSSASPVLRTELTIQLDMSYPETLNATDFTCILHSQEDVNYTRSLYIMSVDDSAKTVTVKFPGAPSGEYYLVLSSEQHGRLDSDQLILNVHSTVHSVSPLRGSKYGGALVTITGENFSDNALDNPVKIGDNYCYVITTSANEITCRTDLLTDQMVGENLVIVFLKTSEEAVTLDGEDIMFTFEAPIAEITDIQVEFSDIDFNHKVVVSGSGFDDSIQLLIDGFEQVLDSQDGASATFSLTNLDNTSSEDVTVFTSAGYPEGSEITHSIDVAPALLMIDPIVGSSAGSKIKVVGSGFGQNTNINLAANGVELCDSVEIYEQGSFYCFTKAMEVAEGSAITITVDGSVKEGSFVAGDAAYSQTEMMTVTDIQLAQNTITFTGSGFLTDHSPSASIRGVEADSVTVNSDTEVVAQWTSTGVPLSDQIPTLTFTHADGYSFDASTASTIAFNSTKDITSSSSGLECSFAGGCTYQIEADGLYATLLDQDNQIKMCGSTCSIREDLSTSTHAVCEMPQLATTYSIENYKIKGAADLTGTSFPTDTEILHDGLTVESYISSLTQGCEFGMTFKEGHVAVLDEAKVFIGFLKDKTPYVDQLQFHGSNDNWATFDLLHTFSDEVHEGWNYIDYRDDGVIKPAYNSYRFWGNTTGSCKVTEFKLHGVEAVADENDNYQCTPKIMIGETEMSTSIPLEPVTYSAAMTPKLTAISPRFGSVLGGTTVTLSGENLEGTGQTSVMFDNRVCEVQSTSATEIVCITDDKPYVPDTPVAHISIEGLGLVATQGLIYRYVSLWSDPETWGGDIPPIEGESIAIPTGQHLLVDIDHSPILNAIIVEGSMIFPSHEDPQYQRTFDANFIMVFHGYFEIGTEEFPYTSKLLITMHATRDSPSFAIYGAKMIGCRFCNLSMHGIPKTTTWTRLSETAEAGATQIVVYGEPDWEAGDHIAIAGTGWHDDYDHEERVIASISGSVITLTEALEFQHLSVAPTYDGIEMPMRAEVGLLTRNVVFRGNPEDSKKDLFGAHIMIHSPGDESSVARIHYIELTESGQAFSLGRYAIHFHMIGTVHGSLVKGNSVHHSYNRACTTHGVHYFRVEQNVAFDTMGHSFFIEDAVETKCVYDGNLSILTRASNSFLNTDQTPGAWWITNADNIFINNAMAGSDAYGYWFDMQETAIGANYDPNVCPERTKLGEFRNNTAHGVRKYGLRIFHALVPHQFPCKASPYDENYIENGFDDPYHENPKIPAIFDDFVGYKCGLNGAITERTGYVIFNNFRVADNGVSGVEFAIIEDIRDGYAALDNSIIIGNTGYGTDRILAREFGDVRQQYSYGFIGPKTDFMTVRNTRFYSYDWDNSAVFGSCSHCFHPASSNAGGWTYSVQNLTFTDCTRLVRFEIPHREMIKDLDGSLTGLGPDSWVVSGRRGFGGAPHLNVEECTLDMEVYDGVICDGRVQARRMMIYNADSELRQMWFKIAQWDEDIVANVTSADELLFDYTQDVEHQYFTAYQMRLGPNPGNSWTFPIITGHKYRMHFGEGNDIDAMDVQLGQLAEATDENIHIMMNFTDLRASINLTTIPGGELMENETYVGKSEEELVGGDNVIYNQTEVKEFHFVMNAKDETRTHFRYEGFRCVVNCDLPQVEEKEVSGDAIPWSDPASWDSGSVPVEGDEVEIPPGVWIEFDIEETPLLKLLTVNGRLTFKNDNETAVDRTIHAYNVFVRAGELFVGDEFGPYNGIATIKLYGEPIDDSVAFSMYTEGGNKGLLNVGTVAMYGKDRSQMSRLREACFSSDKSALVYPGLDWVAGDQVALLPTATHWTHTDYMTIESYDAQTGDIVFTSGLRYYHWGQSKSTAGDYSGVDMRGEVILLTRNVRVVGNDTDSWGAQIVTADTIELNGEQRTGSIYLDNVECYNCSQRNTIKAGIRFENAQLGYHTVKNSVVWGGLGWAFAAHSAKNVAVQNTYFIGGRAVGVGVTGNSQNVTFDGIVTADIQTRPEMLAVMDNMEDKEACVTICAFFGPEPSCRDNKIVNSISAGCVYSGFVVPGHTCGDAENQDNFRDNVAHSIEMGGAYIFPDPAGNGHLQCYEGSHFSAYKCGMTGAGAHFITQEIRFSNMVMIDNTLGINVLTSGETNHQLSVLKETDIYGEAGSDDCPKSHPCWCKHKYGIQTFGGNMGTKDWHIQNSSPMPMQHIMSYGSWAAATDFYKVNFKKWQSAKTACGKRQVTIGLIKDQSDFVPVQRFYGATFEDVHDDAMAFIMDPQPQWNNIDDCVGFPCTAPSNVVMEYQLNSYDGFTKPSNTARNMQIVADTAGVSETFDDCEFKEAWNAWQCENEYLGQLCFIADDVDWEDRSPTPIWVRDESSGYVNKVQHMMDHMWDGFYTGQKHKSQYTSMIQTNRNYTIEYSGTPWKDQRFEMRSEKGQSKITVQYWNSQTIRVYADETLIDANPFDESIGVQKELTGYKGCGENRWIALKNQLEFIITPYCTIRLEYFDSIQSNVRMEWTMDEFFESGGVTSFVDRVSAALGIHASQMKVVAVYTGSVVVDYVIEPEQTSSSSSSSSSSSDSLAQLRAIEKNLNTLVESGASEVFGAPVLSASTNSQVIIEDPTYNPATRPTQTTQIQQTQIPESVEEEKDETVTLSDDAAVAVTTTAAASMIIVIIVVAMIVLCCAGFGTLLVCFYQVNQSSNQVIQAQKKHAQAIELKKQGIAEASESVIEVDQQFVLPEDMDIDIFSKKRQMKVNEDENEAQFESHHQRDDSRMNLRDSVVTNKALVEDREVYLDSNQKLVTAKLGNEQTERKIVASLKPIEENE